MHSSLYGFAFDFSKNLEQKYLFLVEISISEWKTLFKMVQTNIREAAAIGAKIVFTQIEQKKQTIQFNESSAKMLNYACQVAFTSKRRSQKNQHTYRYAYQNNTTTWNFNGMKIVEEL